MTKEKHTTRARPVKSFLQIPYDQIKQGGLFRPYQDSNSELIVSQKNQPRGFKTIGILQDDVLLDINYFAINETRAFECRIPKNIFYRQVNLVSMQDNPLGYEGLASKLNNAGIFRKENINGK
jgi:hypothetical protein